VVDEKLQVEHREINSLIVFPIFGDEHAVHIERPQAIDVTGGFVLRRTLTT